MGKDLGPSCRQCRREGEKLFLKGTRCFTHKCAIDRRQYAPGQHGIKRVKLSNYGLQLREKQKLKRIYGLLEKQFRLYFEKAAHRKGVTGTVLLQFLERRLDNVIFQLGFATSRREGRQIVSHGFVHVNDRPVNIPSYLVRENDEISIKGKEGGLKAIRDNIQALGERPLAGWLEVDKEHLRGKIKRFPQREDIQFQVNEQLVVELYSR